MPPHKSLIPCNPVRGRTSRWGTSTQQRRTSTRAMARRPRRQQKPMAPTYESRQPLRPLQPRHVGETACLLHLVGHSSVCIPACNRRVTGACPLPQNRRLLAHTGACVGSTWSCWAMLLQHISPQQLDTDVGHGATGRLAHRQRAARQRAETAWQRPLSQGGGSGGCRAQSRAGGHVAAVANHLRPRACKVQPCYSPPVPLLNTGVDQHVHTDCCPSH